MHKIQISQLKPQKITPMAAAGLLGPDLLAKHSKLQLSIVISLFFSYVYGQLATHPQTFLDKRRECCTFCLTRTFQELKKNFICPILETRRESR